MEATEYLIDFDRCLSLINRCKEIDREINKTIGKPGAFVSLLQLQQQKEVLTNSIENIYNKYDTK